MTGNVFDLGERRLDGKLARRRIAYRDEARDEVRIIESQWLEILVEEIGAELRRRGDLR